MYETEAEKAEHLNRMRVEHLRDALKKRDELAKQLRNTDAYIEREGRLYWKHCGYSVMPRIERLRAAILGA